MSVQLKYTVNTAFCLGFDVKKSEVTRSGFEPAQTDRGGSLFAELRLEGFAAALETGFAKNLVILGGAEQRYEDVNRAEAIRKMLVDDLAIDGRLVETADSRSTTQGDIDSIRRHMKARLLKEDDCCVLTSIYHTARSGLDLYFENLRLPNISAEAFLILATGKTQATPRLDENEKILIDRLGGGPLAARLFRECRGIAAKIAGTYVPLTNDPATE